MQTISRETEKHDVDWQPHIRGQRLEEMQHLQNLLNQFNKNMNPADSTVLKKFKGRKMKK